MKKFKDLKHKPKDVVLSYVPIIEIIFEQNIRYKEDIGKDIYVSDYDFNILSNQYFQLNNYLNSYNYSIKLNDETKTVRFVTC